MTDLSPARLREHPGRELPYGIDLHSGHAQSFNFLQSLPQGQAQRLQTDANSQRLHERHFSLSSASR